MTDTVRYAIGFGPLGELAHRALVRRDLEAIFDFRAAARARRCWHGARRGATGADRGEAVEDEVRRRAGRRVSRPGADQATTPSGPTMTSARFVMPAGSK